MMPGSNTGLEVDVEPYTQELHITPIKLQHLSLFVTPGWRDAVVIMDQEQQLSGPRSSTTFFPETRN